MVIVLIRLASAKLEATKSVFQQLDNERKVGVRPRNGSVHHEGTWRLVVLTNILLNKPQDYFWTRKICLQKIRRLTTRLHS